jgi:very-short-patch-repair endonuclease
MPSRAQRLRKNPTRAEIRLWHLLEPFRDEGYHFRKQAPIGPYVVDFACHHAKLVIEVDGDSHGYETGKRRDAVRDAFLKAEGYTVLRFWNDEVTQAPEGVYDIVSRALMQTPSLALPTRGRVGRRARGNIEAENSTSRQLKGTVLAHPRAPTSPLVGETRRGVAAKHIGGEDGQ